MIDIQKLADLARLEVPEAELKTVAAEFSSILSYVDQIKNASIANNEIAPFLENRLREDVAMPSSEPDSLVTMAPEHTDSFIKVPKVIE